MNREKTYSPIINIIIYLGSLMAGCYIFMSDKPNCYNLLPILPIGYGILMLMSIKTLKCIPENIGATLILVLSFIRYVIEPLTISISGFSPIMKNNLFYNMPRAILLMIYEMLCVFMTLFYVNSRNIKVSCTDRIVSVKKYKFNLAMLLIILFGIIIIVPQLLYSYRTIFGIGDSDYTTLEQTDIVRDYGTGFVQRLLLVLGNMLFRCIRIMLPAYVIIRLSNNQNTLPISIVVALTPFLIVDGTIGRSVYFSLILFYIIFYVYNPQRVQKLLKLAIISGCVFLIYYWYVRYTVAHSYMKVSEYVAGVLDSYFCGVNMVSGTFNLSGSFDDKVTYAIADFLKSFPFGNTIFRMDKVDYFQTIYNDANNSYGKIPPTIGTCRFYYGYILAPLYSIVLTAVSFVSGQRASATKDSFERLLYLLISTFAVLSFNMYSIQAGLTLLFGIALPIWGINMLSKEKNGDKNGK